MQAGELVKSDAWKQGNLEGALADTYLKIDEILSREDTRAELMEMAGSNKEQPKYVMHRPSLMPNEDTTIPSKAVQARTARKLQQ